MKFRREFHEKRPEITLSPEELELAREEISQVGLSHEAETFLTYLSLSRYDPYTGVKRPNEPRGEGETHYRAYFSGKVRNTPSERFFISLAKYARGLAWLMGKEEVGVGEILFVAPYALAHRLEFEDWYLQQNLDDRNMIDQPDKSFLPLYAARMLLKETYDTYRRNEDTFLRLLDLVRKGRIEEVKEMFGGEDDPTIRYLVDNLEVRSV